MSLATLKKKSQRYFNPISSTSQFSLNDRLRSQGWVGQTSLSRTNVRALKKGTDLIANGGDQGKYERNSLTDGIIIDNPPSVIKTTKNTNGLILSKIIHPTSVNNSNIQCDKSPCNIVQKFDNDYIHELSLKTLCNDVKPQEYKVGSSTTCCFTRHGPRKVMYSNFVKKSNETMTSQDYTHSRLLIKNCLPTPPCLQPFPMKTNNNPRNICSGSQKNYKNSAEAIADNALPSDWMACKNTVSPDNLDYCKIQCKL